MMTCGITIGRCSAAFSAAISRVSCVQGDGGKVCCGLRYLLQDRPCLAYSLGSAGDTTFEQELVNRTSCQVAHVSYAAPSLATVPPHTFWWRGRSFRLCETLVDRMIDLISEGEAASAGAHL